LAVVGVNVTNIETNGTSGDFVGPRVILASWFTDIVETVGLTIFTFNKLTIIISSTDTSESFVTVGVSFALIGKRFTGICV